MIDRKKYDSVINALEGVCKHYENPKLLDSVNFIKHLINNFVIKLLMVGDFSAGKSSLINGLIEREGYLEEGQADTTAIATELIYDTNERAYAYKENGDVEEYEKETPIDNKKYSHLEYRLPSDGLKAVSDFTFVDTPGLNSYNGETVEANNRAISKYLAYGSAYLVVIDQEKGEISSEILNFLDEISNYTDQIAILINKCDKITEETSELIADKVRSTLDAYNHPYKVYTISKRDNDVKDKLVSIISNFSSQAIFDKAIWKTIQSELYDIDKILQFTKRKLFLDTFDLQSEIDSVNSTKRNLAYIFERKQKAFTSNLDSAVTDILSVVRSSLISRADAVTNAFLIGNSGGVKAIIAETLRLVFISSMKEVSSRHIDGITKSLDFSGVVNEKDKVDLGNVVVNLANNLKGLISKGAFYSTGNESKGSNSGSGSGRAAYYAITGVLAASTTVLAPWMEVIVILLPDIIDLCKFLFCDSQFDITKDRFIETVIPQICNNIAPYVEECIKKNANTIIDEYKCILENKMSLLERNLQDAELKKKEKTEVYNSYKENLDKDIDGIHQLINGEEF